MNKFKIILKILFSILLVLIYAYTAYLLNNLGFLSNKYAIIFMIVSLIILLLVILGIFKVKKVIAKVFLYLIGIIAIVLMIVGTKYLNSTKKFIDNISKEKVSYDYYYVMVLKDSKYNKLSDLKGKTIGKTGNTESNVMHKIKMKYTEKAYANTEFLYKGLQDNTIDSMVLSSVEEYLLEQNEPDFTDKVKVIYTIKVKNKKIKKATKSINEPFILFISGIDIDGKISKVSRSDVNIVVTVNPNTHEVLLTTVPRDYYVMLHGTTGLKDKLTHAGIYGIDMSVKTVEDLLDINIDYYLRVNFDTVVKLVDQMGGITIYAEKDLNYCNIKKGYNKINGKCALQFSRDRKSFSSGDRHRGQNQEEVIKAIINKAQNSSVLLTNYNSILQNLENNFETNVSNDTIKEAIKLQMKDMPKWNVNNYNLNGSDSKNYTYSVGLDYYTHKEDGKMLYVMEPDYKTVNNAKKYIKEIYNGKRFNEIGVE